MSLTKTPICDFGKKAQDFKLKSINNIIQPGFFRVVFKVVRFLKRPIKWDLIIRFKRLNYLLENSFSFIVKRVTRGK